MKNLAAFTAVAVACLSFAAPSARSAQTVPCEDMLQQLRTAVDAAKLSDADATKVKELEDKGAGVWKCGSALALARFQRTSALAHFRTLADGEPHGSRGLEAPGDPGTAPDHARLDPLPDETQLRVAQDDRVLDLRALDLDVLADRRVRPDVGAGDDRLRPDAMAYLRIEEEIHAARPFSNCTAALTWFA